MPGAITALKIGKMRGLGGWMSDLDHRGHERLLGNRLSKVQSKRVALVTIPCYPIVFTMLGGAALAAFAHLAYGKAPSR